MLMKRPSSYYFIIIKGSWKKAKEEYLKIIFQAMILRWIKKHGTN